MLETSAGIFQHVQPVNPFQWGRRTKNSTVAHGCAPKAVLAIEEGLKMDPEALNACLFRYPGVFLVLNVRLYVEMRIFSLSATQPLRILSG